MLKLIPGTRRELLAFMADHYDGLVIEGFGVGGLPGILSIQPSYWQVFALAMAIAIIIPIVLTSFIYQRKYRLGTLDIV